MPDEAPEETQDTPEAAAPTSDGGTPAPESTDDSQAQTTTDWEKRYTDLQPEYTRASQEAAQLRQIIAAAQGGDREAIELLGLALADDDEPEDDDEAQPLQDPRVDALLQAEAQRQAEVELDTLESHVDTEIDKLAKSASYELSDEERDLVFAALTPKEDGRTPDVEKAFKKVTGLRDHHVKSYVAGKHRSPQAPSGSSPSHQPDLDDPKQRREYIASRLGD